MRKFLRSVVVCAVCVMGLAPLSALAAQFKIMVAPRFERRDGAPSEEVRRAAPISDLPGRRLGAFLTELERVRLSGPKSCLCRAAAEAPE